MRFWDKFWSNVSFPRGGSGGCWLWHGQISSHGGYGQLTTSRHSTSRAHRVAWAILRGEIPDGMVLDHVKAKGCISNACVNPDHLEPVTVGENVRRGKLQYRYVGKTHCPHGHSYSGDNLIVNKVDGARQCRECGRVKMREYARRPDVKARRAIYLAERKRKQVESAVC